MRLVLLPKLRDHSGLATFVRYPDTYLFHYKFIIMHSAYVYFTLVLCMPIVLVWFMAYGA